MKKISLFFTLFIGLYLNAQDIKQNQAKQIVEVACGQCQFGMQDKAGCDLAVRIEGKSYFVEGTDIHKHGDAHAKDGFCSTIRKAEVTGKIDSNKFVVSEFKLLPFVDHKPSEHEGHNH